MKKWLRCLYCCIILYLDLIKTKGKKRLLASIDFSIFSLFWESDLDVIPFQYARQRYFRGAILPAALSIHTEALITWERYELWPVRLRPVRLSLHEPGLKVWSDYMRPVRDFRSAWMFTWNMQEVPIFLLWSASLCLLLLNAELLIRIQLKALPDQVPSATAFWKLDRSFFTFFFTYVNRNKHLYGDRSEVVPVWVRTGLT